MQRKNQLNFLYDNQSQIGQHFESIYKSETSIFEFFQLKKTGVIHIVAQSREGQVTVDFVNDISTKKIPLKISQEIKSSSFYFASQGLQ